MFAKHTSQKQNRKEGVTASGRRVATRNKIVILAISLCVTLALGVTATFAWFTMSTAPEVSGVNTQIASNGTLEMALLPANGSTNSIGSGIVGTMDPKVTNYYWGNLVYLSEGFGLDEIDLHPARLNVSRGYESDWIVMGYNGSGSILKTPVYHDGRVISLEEKTVSGLYSSDSNSFQTASTQQYGVRAIGTTSSQSVQQMAFVSAMSSMSNNEAVSRSVAQSAMNKYGGALADMAIEHSVNSKVAEYTRDDITAIKEYALALQTSFTYIENALRNAIVAYTSTKVDDEVAFASIKNVIETTTISLSSLQGYGIEIPEEISKYFDKIKADKESLQKIVEDMNILLALTGNSFMWSQISSSVSKLVDTSKITMNGFAIGDIKDNKDTITQSVLSEGINLVVLEGGGITADIADFSGNYSTNITLSAAVEGIPVSSIKSTFSTQSTASPSHLLALLTYVSTLSPQASVSEVAKIIDTYGYSIDLALRTNAANSTLLLQTEDARRVSTDSSNEAAQGAGSFFAFTSNDETMFQADEQGNNCTLARFMGALRVIFTDGNGNIIAVGATSRSVDRDDAVTFLNGIENDYFVEDGYVKSYISLYNYHFDNSGALCLDEKLETNQLRSLTQNVATKLSVIVYLDGDIVDNSYASATDKVVGTFNVQFASDADLVPSGDSGFSSYKEYIYMYQVSPQRDVYYTYADTYFKGEDENWYTKSYSNYLRVTDNDLIATLNAKATPITEYGLIGGLSYETTTRSSILDIYTRDSMYNWYLGNSIVKGVQRFKVASFDINNANYVELFTPYTYTSTEKHTLANGTTEVTYTVTQYLKSRGGFWYNVDGTRVKNTNLLRPLDRFALSYNDFVDYYLIEVDGDGVYSYAEYTKASDGSWYENDDGLKLITDSVLLEKLEKYASNNDIIKVIPEYGVDGVENPTAEMYFRNSDGTYSNYKNEKVTDQRLLNILNSNTYRVYFGNKEEEEQWYRYIHYSWTEPDPDDSENTITKEGFKWVDSSGNDIDQSLVTLLLDVAQKRTSRIAYRRIAYGKEYSDAWVSNYRLSSRHVYYSGDVYFGEKYSVNKPLLVGTDYDILASMHYVYLKEADTGRYDIVYYCDSSEAVLSQRGYYKFSTVDNSLVYIGNSFKELKLIEINDLTPYIYNEKVKVETKEEVENEDGSKTEKLVSVEWVASNNLNLYYRYESGGTVTWIGRDEKGYYVVSAPQQDEENSNQPADPEAGDTIDTEPHLYEWLTAEAVEFKCQYMYLPAESRVDRTMYYKQGNRWFAVDRTGLLVEIVDEAFCKELNAFAIDISSL